MLRSTFGYSVSKPSLSVLRKEPIPPSSKTQKSRVTGSPPPVSGPVPVVPSPPSSSPPQATTTRDRARAATNERRHFIHVTFLEPDGGTSPPIRPTDGNRRSADASPPRTPRARGLARGNGNVLRSVRKPNRPAVGRALRGL